MTPRLSASLTALALISVISALTMPAMAASTPLKLSPSADKTTIDTSQLATKQDLAKLSSAIIQVYGKLAELDKRVRLTQGAGGGGDASGVSLQIAQLAQQINQLQTQQQALQASQNQLRESITAILDRMHRLDGATVNNP